MQEQVGSLPLTTEERETVNALRAEAMKIEANAAARETWTKSRSGLGQAKADQARIDLLVAKGQVAGATMSPDGIVPTPNLDALDRKLVDAAKAPVASSDYAQAMPGAFASLDSVALRTAAEQISKGLRKLERMRDGEPRMDLRDIRAHLAAAMELLR